MRHPLSTHMPQIPSTHLRKTPPNMRQNAPAILWNAHIPNRLALYQYFERSLARCVKSAPAPCPLPLDTDRSIKLQLTVTLGEFQKVRFSRTRDNL